MSDTHGKALTVIERHDTQHMSPVVAAGLAILEKHPSPETLRELLSVQREWEAGEALKAYTAALIELKRDLPTVIERDQKVDFTNRSGQRTFYRHASLAQVMEAVTEPLTRHGFSLTWHPSTNKGDVEVVCRLTHRGGHFVETRPVSAPIDNTGNKSPAQGVASTITLLQRYTACSLLGIATRDHVDPVGASEKPAVDPDHVDTNRNMKACGRLSEYGKTRKQAEEFLKRRVGDWTAADIDRLSEWCKSAPAREAGSDDE